MLRYLLTADRPIDGQTDELTDGELDGSTDRERMA